MSDFENVPEKIPLEKQKISIEDAVMFIEMTKQECAILGANDTEIPTLMQLVEDVKAGNIDPSEAKKQAAQIKEAKMDYR